MWKWSIFAGLILCGWIAEGAPKPLNLLIWSEYIDPQLVKEFEAKARTRLQIDLFEEAESMLAKVQSAGPGVYDLVVTPDYLVPSMIRSKLLAPLRRERIPNLGNLEEKFRDPPFDPGNRYSAAYQWGTVGIYTRRKAGQTPAQSWGFIFDPKERPGRFALIDSMRDLVGAALKYKGYSLNSTNAAQLREARDLILEAKKRAVSMEGSVSGKNKLLGKMLDTAIVYSGEAARGMAEDPETIYFLPREGSQVWMDNMVVCAGSAQRDLAEDFINFILDPAVGARLTVYTKFASPNAASRKLLPANVRNDPAIYPAVETMGKLEFLEDVGKATRLYDEVWTEIKSR